MMKKIVKMPYKEGEGGSGLPINDKSQNNSYSQKTGNANLNAVGITIQDKDQNYTIGGVFKGKPLRNADIILDTDSSVIVKKDQMVEGVIVQRPWYDQDVKGILVGSYFVPLRLLEQQGGLLSNFIPVAWTALDPNKAKLDNINKIPSTGNPLSGIANKMYYLNKACKAINLDGQEFSFDTTSVPLYGGDYNLSDERIWLKYPNGVWYVFPYWAIGLVSGGKTLKANPNDITNVGGLNDIATLKELAFYEPSSYDLNHLGNIGLRQQWYEMLDFMANSIKNRTTAPFRDIVLGNFEQYNAYSDETVTLTGVIMRVNVDRTTNPLRFNVAFYGFRNGVRIASNLFGSLDYAYSNNYIKQQEELLSRVFMSLRIGQSGLDNAASYSKVAIDNVSTQGTINTKNLVNQAGETDYERNLRISIEKNEQLLKNIQEANQRANSEAERRALQEREDATIAEKNRQEQEYQNTLASNEAKQRALEEEQRRKIEVARQVQNQAQSTQQAAQSFQQAQIEQQVRSNTVMSAFQSGVAAANSQASNIATNIATPVPKRTTVKMDLTSSAKASLADGSGKMSTVATEWASNGVWGDTGKNGENKAVATANMANEKSEALPIDPQFAALAQQSQNPNPNNTTNPNTTKKPEKKSNVGLIVGILVGAAVIGGGGYYAYQNGYLDNIIPQDLNA